MTDREPMTPERARALLEAATPGPWAPRCWWGSEGGVAAVGPRHHGDDEEPGSPAHRRAEADAAIIAAAPDLAAAFLAEHGARVAADNMARQGWEHLRAAEERAQAAEAERDLVAAQAAEKPDLVRRIVDLEAELSRLREASRALLRAAHDRLVQEPGHCEICDAVIALRALAALDAEGT